VEGANHGRIPANTVCFNKKEQRLDRTKGFMFIENVKVGCKKVIAGTKIRTGVKKDTDFLECLQGLTKSLGRKTRPAKKKRDCCPGKATLEDVRGSCRKTKGRELNLLKSGKSSQQNVKGGGKKGLEESLDSLGTVKKKKTEGKKPRIGKLPFWFKKN